MNLSVAQPASRDTLVADCAQLLVDAFADYNAEFRLVTRRAPQRFEERDWRGSQKDAVERIELYDKYVTGSVELMRQRLGEDVHERAIWSSIKRRFDEIIDPLPDNEFIKTFFSSVTRKTFGTVGVDPAVEFVAPPPARLLRPPGAPVCASYAPTGDTAALLRRVLEERALDAAWQDLERDVRLGAAAIEARLGGPLDRERAESVQVVRPLFFRNKAAYVVGRVLSGSEIVPLVLALTHPPGGVVLDAVLLSADEVSQVFGFTRSYFHVDVRQPYETVRFLKSILPAKPVAELYISIGYNKHGKTELYRDLLRHLADSDEPFVIAPGDRGMVMEVFTLPSLDVVFKVIKDVFAPPKTTTREEVMAKYRMVFRHDRAGRLIDTQEYEHLEFERERFSPRLLARLLEDAGGSVTATDERVAIRHLYTSRRIVPLNLHLASAPPDAACAAAVEFGQAIKDLAASNVFPGDLLPKNFGVTRHGRAVFYDYDELCPLTDCDFRELPAGADEEGAADGPPFFVGPRDIFPEEFERFLGLRGAARDAFLDAHADLLSPRFWCAMQERIRAGEFPDFFPYPAARRLHPTRGSGTGHSPPS